MFLEILNVFINYVSTYASPVRIWRGTDIFIILDNPVDVETVLTSPHCLTKEKLYRFIKEGLDTNGLVTNEGLNILNFFFNE